MYSPPRYRMPLKIFLVALSLSVACTSSRDTPTDPPTKPEAPKTPAPTAIENGGASTTESNDANPFGGCDMCHIDVADKLAGTRHETKGIGCVQCHGQSIGHIRDENNEVKPDRVFTRKDMDALCGSCHKCSSPPTSTPQSKLKQGQQVCSDCHGTHKIIRTGISSQS